MTIAQVAMLMLLTTNAWRGGLRSVTELNGLPSIIAFGLLGCATLAVMWLWWRSARLVTPALGALGPRAIVVLVVNALLTVALVRPITDFAIHTAVTVVAMLVSLGAVLVAAVSTPRSIRDGLAAWVAISSRVRVYAAFGVVFVSTILSVVVFQRIPHVPDEVVYLFQSKMLAAGMLSVPALPGGAAWDTIYTMHERGQWFGIFPPGWPALLALGVRAGVPWLVNPLLAGAVVLVVHAAARRLAGLRAANWSVILLATSPWFLFLGASFMSHMATLLFTATAVGAACRLACVGNTKRSVHGARSADRLPVLLAILGGVALGALVLTRPIEGVVAGLTIAIWLLVVAPGEAFAPRGLLFAASALGTGALYLPYNAALTGRALVDPITRYFDTRFYAGANRLGFGANVGNLGWGNDVFPGHSLFEAAINANANSHLVQLELFGWGFGSLLVVIAYTVSRRRRWDRVDALLFSLIGAVVVAYGAYWYSGADFGPRYWSQMLLPLAILTGRGIVLLDAAVSERDDRIRTPNGHVWAVALLIASVMGAPMVITMRSVGKYRDYRGMTTAVVDLAREHRFANDLVLLHGDVFSDYAAGMMLNDAVPIDGRPVYARYVEGGDLAALRTRFPERSVWVIDRIAGPLSALHATPLAERQP